LCRVRRPKIPGSTQRNWSGRRKLKIVRAGLYRFGKLAACRHQDGRMLPPAQQELRPPDFCDVGASVWIPGRASLRASRVPQGAGDKATPSADAKRPPSAQQELRPPDFCDVRALCWIPGRASLRASRVPQVAGDKATHPRKPKCHGRLSRSFALPISVASERFAGFPGGRAAVRAECQAA
jgi:hypothetical protein